MAAPMRRLAILVSLFLTQCVSGSTSATSSAIAAQNLLIAATPVSVFPADPNRRRLGALTFLGGWRLGSETRSFGAVSSLAVTGREVVALTDAGAVVRFRLGRFGRVSAARIAPAPAGCGSQALKADRDTEAIAHDAGHWWIGYESRNVICRTDETLLTGERVARPPAMARWPRTGGAESLVRLADGRFLVFAERRRGSGADKPVLLFDRDPTDPAAIVAELSYRPPDGYRPVDAAQLPDGRILVLNRRFTLWSLFTARLVLLDPQPLVAGALLKGPTIARFDAPALTENYEGLAVSEEAGRVIVWIASDDNFMRWQRTLLLKFALSVRASPAASRPALSR